MTEQRAQAIAKVLYTRYCSSTCSANFKHLLIWPDWLTYKIITELVKYNRAHTFTNAGDYSHTDYYIWK